MLRCPRTGEALRLDGQLLINESGSASYRIGDDGIPLFAQEFCSPEAAAQQEHYDEIADAYAANLAYPHTQEYMDYLDRVLREEIGDARLGLCGELCCGTGEAFALFRDSVDTGIGVDVSSSMLAKALNAPLVATSANRGGEPPAQSAVEAGRLEGIDLLLDGGLTAGGAPSTVVAFDERGGIEILRQGACDVR